MHFLPFVILFSLLSCVSCAQVNVTIDDTYGNSNTGAAITYYPADAWQAGQSCGNCTANVDASQTYDNSWHDATYNPVDGTSNAYPGTIISASVSFTGSAVYVYCILTGSSSSPDGNTDMTFLVDGSSAGSFSRAANGDNSYAYNQVVFGTSSLTQGQHNLTIQSGHGGAKALVLLDRIVYTTDESDVTTTLAPATTTSSTPSSSSSSSSLESSTQQTTGSSSSSASSTLISPTSTTALTTLATTPSTSSGDSNLPSISFSQPAASSSSSSSSNAATGSSHSHSHSTGTIVGAVLGSVGAILIALLLWWLLARRKRLAAAEDDAGRAVQPFFGRPRAMSGTTGSFGNDATFLTLQHSTSAHSPVTPTFDGTSATSPETPSAVRARFNAYAALERPPNTHADNARLVPPSPPAAAAAAAAAGPSHAVHSRPLPLPKVSPFSPTPLYAPTNNLSPTTASGSNGSTNGRNLEALSNVALLRPNRRYDPGPYSRVGRTGAGAGAGAGARAEERDEEDSESDIRWQRKIVNVFTPSARRRSLPTPPLLPGEPPLPPPPPVGVPASRPSPPPPYHPQRSGRL